LTFQLIEDDVGNPHPATQFTSSQGDAPQSRAQKPFVAENGRRIDDNMHWKFLASGLLTE